MDEEQRKLLELPFSMVIEDVFTIKNRRDVCITGRAKSGMLREGDKIYLVGNGKMIETTVARFGMFIRDPASFVAHAGDNLGFLIKDVDQDDIQRGMIVTTDPTFTNGIQ